MLHAMGQLWSSLWGRNDGGDIKGKGDARKYGDEEAAERMVRSYVCGRLTCGALDLP